MTVETLAAHGYKCVDCDRVFFALEKELPKSCPFCQCPSVIRIKEAVTVSVTAQGGEAPAR